MLAFVRQRRATHPRDLQAAFGRETTRNGWGGLSKAATQALDALLHHGLVRVSGREGGIRVYGPTAPQDQALSPVSRLARWRWSWPTCSPRCGCRVVGHHVAPGALPVWPGLDRARWRCGPVV